MSSKVCIICVLAIFFLVASCLWAEYLIVANSSAETLSKVNLNNGAIRNNFASLGIVPNRVVCRYGKAYVINSESADLYIINLRNDSLEHVVDLGMGKNPWAASFIDDSSLLVTNFVTNTIAKVDVFNQSIRGEWPIGNGPQGLLAAGTRSYIAVTGFIPDGYSYGQGQVAVWDHVHDSLIRIINVGTNPQELDLGPDGQLYVVCTGDYQNIHGMLYVVDTALLLPIDSFQTSSSPFPPVDVAVDHRGVGFLAAGGWVNRGEVFTFDAWGDSLLHGESNPLYTSRGVIAVVGASDSTVFTVNFYADNITEMDSSGRILATYGVGDGPIHVALSEDCPFFVGDANGDGPVNVSDAVYVINYVFAGGHHPLPIAEAGDANCDFRVNVSDAVHIINYVFAGGSPACGCNSFQW